MTACPICDSAEYTWRTGCPECRYYDEDGHRIRDREHRRFEERLRDIERGRRRF